MVAGRPDTEPVSLDLHLEVDPADAEEQSRDLVEDAVDPERPAAARGPAGGAGDAIPLEADEADLAYQWAEVGDDFDDADR